MKHEEEIRLNVGYLDIRIDKEQANKKRPTRIEMYKTVVKVRKKKVGGERRINYQERKPRTNSKEYTRRVKRNLMNKLMNESGFQYFVTLTYPSTLKTPSTDDLRRDRSRLLRAFKKLGISGVIIAESHANREIPHYHLVIDRYVTKAEMFLIWCTATKLNCNDVVFGFRGVRVEAIHDMDSLARYLVKSEQKECPTAVKRWAGFGKYKGAVKPLAVIEGTSESLAVETRTLRKLGEAERRKQSLLRGGKQKRLKDKGSVGFSVYGDAAKAFIRTKGKKEQTPI